VEVYGAGLLPRAADHRNANGDPPPDARRAGNVVRRVLIAMSGSASAPRGSDGFYLCDNILEGRLTWPQVYTDDNGAHANDEDPGAGSRSRGLPQPHHGFGDASRPSRTAPALTLRQRGLYAYDNGSNSTAARERRCFRNRFTNVTPAQRAAGFGGPAYLIRNVAVNSVHEQMNSTRSRTPPQEPSGILACHNTFVSPYRALNFRRRRTRHFGSEQSLRRPGTMRFRVVDWTGRTRTACSTTTVTFPMAFSGGTCLRTGRIQKLRELRRRPTAGIEPHGCCSACPLRWR